jgi:hypothetical protein
VGSFNRLDDRRRHEWATRLVELGCDHLVLGCLRPVLDAIGLDEHHDAGRFLVACDALLEKAGVIRHGTVAIDAGPRAAKLHRNRPPVQRTRDARSERA